MKDGVVVVATLGQSRKVFARLNKEAQGLISCNDHGSDAGYLGRMVIVELYDESALLQS